jgi:hypothetical protein
MRMGGQRKFIQGLWWGNLRTQTPGVDGKEILEDGMYRAGRDSSGSLYGQITAVCECGNKLSGYIKCGESLD